MAFQGAGVVKENGTPNHGEIAGIVGESQGTWSRYHRGHSSPSALKLTSWILKAEENGWSVRLVFADGACTAEVWR
jgi:hypothetical protein